MEKLAQVEHRLPGIIQGLGDYGNIDPNESPSLLTTFISSLIGLLTIIAGIYFFFILIIGAIAWIGSGGDKGKVADARDRVTMGVLGMIVVVAAIFIVRIIGNLIGFPNILDIESLINLIAP